MLEQPPPAAGVEREPSHSAEVSGDRSVAVGRDNRGTIIIGDVTVPWFRSRPQQAAAALVLLVLLTAAAVVIYQFAAQKSEPRPRMTGGGIKIAVAGFDGVDAQGKPLATSRSDDLAMAVYQQLNPIVPVPGRPSLAVWSPQQTGHVPPGAIGPLAEEIGADIIVYGSLRLTADATHLQPRFYISRNPLPDAEELAGDYLLGPEIVSVDDYSRSSATYDDLVTRLTGRVAGLSDTVAGLSQYRRDEFPAAAESFAKAEANKSWVGTQGKEIMLLFGGFNAAKQHEWSTADRYFTLAEGLDRTRARAELGRAEVLFEQAGAQQECTYDAVNLGALHDALTAFQTAAADTASPPLANIQPKARYGIGQVEVCLSQSGREDHWTDAETQFKSVIADYDAGNANLKNLAAESHAVLGFLEQPWAGETDPSVIQAAYTRAANEYSQALALGEESHPVRRAFFAWSLGIAQERLGAFGKAEEAYSLAANVPELDAATRLTYEQARDRVHAARATAGEPPA